MSLQQDIAAVKNEISAEEQFLTGFVHAERFVRKYKKVLLALLVTLIAIFVAYKGWEAYGAHKISVANKAYLKLLANPNDKEALGELAKNSQKLFEAHRLSRAIATDDKAVLAQLSSSQNKPIADLAAYQLAAVTADPNAIAAFAGKQSALKELALIDLAYIHIKAGESAKAKETLSRIPFSSDLKETANYLEHTALSKTAK